MSISTAQVILEFLEDCRSMWRPDTYKDYRQMLNQFAAACPVLPVTREPLIRYFNSMSKLAAASRASHRRNILVLYHWLQKNQRLPFNLLRPAEGGFEFPKVLKERQLRRFLTHEELVNLIAFTRSFQERCIILAFLDTKCRKSEILSMTREKIFPDHALVEGKTGERVVPLSPTTYDLLCQLVPSGPLFISSGKRMRGERLYAIIHEILTRSGLTGDHLGPHILRHSAAVDHIVNGGDLASLQVELGHTTPIMTARYAHLAPQQMIARHKQVNVLGKILQESKVGAICGKCGQHLAFPPANPKQLICSSCHAVGMWEIQENGGNGAGGTNQ